MVSDLASERGRPRNESVRTYFYFSICTCTALTLEQSIRKDVGDVLNGPFLVHRFCFISWDNAHGLLYTRLALIDD